MHYRWNFDEQNLAFLTSEFALADAAGTCTAEQAEQGFLHSSGRMRKAAVVSGSPPNRNR